MAAPFYSQADQDIYASGNKFIPQEQYRLGPYTPPAIMGQNTNAGITSTGVANPYKWPWPIPTGDGGAGNISGTQQRSWSPNQNLGPTNITDYEAEADDVGSTWGGSLARLQDLYSKLPTPGNLIMKGIRKWRENREIKKEQQAAAEQAGAAQAEKTASGVGPTTGQGGQINPGDLRDIGGGFHEYKDSGTAAGYEGSFAQGGRIGYRNGEFVEEDVNIEGPGFDVNENILEIMKGEGVPFGEQVQADPFDLRIQELMGKGLSYDDAYDIAEMEFQDLFAEGPDQDQGLASLV